jgi:hypothetical protein
MQATLIAKRFDGTPGIIRCNSIGRFKPPTMSAGSSKESSIYKPQRKAYQPSDGSLGMMQMASRCFAAIKSM